MIKRYVAVGYAVCIVWLSFGCSSSGGPELLNVILRADPITSAKVEAVLKGDPEFVVPGTEIRYVLRVVRPDPGVEWTMLQVVPDDDIGYAIVFIDSTSGKELPDLSRQLGPVLREKLKTK